MIIFESILTIFKLSIVFRGSWGSIENWLAHNQTTIRKFSLPKFVKRSVASELLIHSVYVLARRKLDKLITAKSIRVRCILCNGGGEKANLFPCLSRTYHSNLDGKAVSFNKLRLFIRCLGVNFKTFYVQFFSHLRFFKAFL